MPNESQRWLIKEYVKTQLENIAEPANWNTTVAVRIGHVSPEQIVGDAESPFFSLQDADGLTVDEERATDVDVGLMVLSIRGYKKTDFVPEDVAWEREREAERLLKDATKAILANPSMGCNAVSASMVTPTRCGSMLGAPGWVEMELTFLITYRMSRIDP